MSVGAITGSGNTTQSSASASGYGALSSQEFMRILLTEMSNQDPFSPQDSSKLMEQISSLRNIESQIQLQETLTSLVAQNQIGAAGGMIGKLVAGLDAANNPVEGLVQSVRMQGGKAFLELDSGNLLAMDRVLAIAPKSEA